MANVTLKVEVTDKRGEYLVNVEVNYEGIVYYTNENGIVEFNVTAEEDCTITLTKDGFISVTKTINKKELLNTIKIQLDDYVETSILVKIKDELGNVPNCHFQYNTLDHYSTNENGRFEITENIVEGSNNRIVVTQDGYDVARVNFEVKPYQRNYVFIDLHIQDNSIGYLHAIVYNMCKEEESGELEPIANATVKVLEGSRVIDTKTTDANGEIDGFIEIRNRKTNLMIEKGNYHTSQNNVLVQPRQEVTRYFGLKTYCTLIFYVKNPDIVDLPATVEYDGRTWSPEDRVEDWAYKIMVPAYEDVYLNVSCENYISKEVFIPASRVKCATRIYETTMLERQLIVECVVLKNSDFPITSAIVTHNDIDYPVDEKGTAYIYNNVDSDCHVLVKAQGYENEELTIPSSELKNTWPRNYIQVFHLQKNPVTLIKAFVHNIDNSAIAGAKIEKIEKGQLIDEFITDNHGKANFIVWNTIITTIRVSAEGYVSKEISIDSAEIEYLDEYDLDIELAFEELPDKILLKATIVNEEDNPLSDTEIVINDNTYYTNENGLLSLLVSRDIDTILNIHKFAYLRKTITIEKAEYVDKRSYETTIVLEKRINVNIEVIVTDKDGLLISSAEIHYKTEIYTTDDEGKVVFTAPVGQAVDLMIAHKNYFTAFKTINGEDIADIDNYTYTIVLEKSSFELTYLRCTVVNTDNVFVNNALIKYEGFDYVTDEEGYVAFDVVSNRDVKLRIIHDDYELKDITIPYSDIHPVNVYDLVIELSEAKTKLTLIQLQVNGVENETKEKVPVPNARIEYNRNITYSDEKGLAEFEVARDDDVDLLIKAKGYVKYRKIILSDEFKDKRIYSTEITLERILIVLMDVSVRSMDYKPIYGAMVGYKGLFYETNLQGKTEFHVVNTEDCVIEVSCDGYKSRTYTITSEELRDEETYYLYVDLEAFKSYKAMTNDIKLVPNEYGEWDIQFSAHDFVNIGGADALHNAIVILLLTRYGELKHNQLYKDDFGCKIHGLIKDNQNSLNKYKVEKYIEESLRKMRRISKINSIRVEDINYGYDVQINVDSVNNERIVVKLELR